jgi:hypothetical protein
MWHIGAISSRMPEGSSQSDSLRRLLRRHRLHEGAYVHVAKCLAVDPSHRALTEGATANRTHVTQKTRAPLPTRGSPLQVTRKRLHNLPD